MKPFQLLSLSVLTLGFAIQANAQSAAQQAPTGYVDQRGFGVEAIPSSTTRDEDEVAKEGVEAAKSSKIGRGFGTEAIYSPTSKRSEDEVAAEGATEARASKIGRGFGTDAIHWEQTPTPSATLAKTPAAAPALQ